MSEGAVVRRLFDARRGPDHFVVVQTDGRQEQSADASYLVSRIKREAGLSCGQCRRVQGLPFIRFSLVCLTSVEGADENNLVSVLENILQLVLEFPVGCQAGKGTKEENEGRELAT